MISRLDELIAWMKVSDVLADWNWLVDPSLETCVSLRFLGVGEGDCSHKLTLGRPGLRAEDLERVVPFIRALPPRVLQPHVGFSKG